MVAFDERETIFSRVGLIEGTKEYEDFYKEFPQYEEVDTHLRSEMNKNMGMGSNDEKNKKKMKRMRTLMKLASKFGINTMSMENGDFGDKKTIPIEIATSKINNPLFRDSAKANKAAIKKKVAKEKVELEPAIASILLKDVAIQYGADVVGIAQIGKNSSYSQRGNMMGIPNGDDSEIRDDYKYAIVLGSAMNLNLLNNSPKFHGMIASTQTYAKSTMVSAQLTSYLKSLGYHALPDNYLKYYSPITQLSLEAGIGELGRSNMVVNPKYGNRMKLAAVWTNMPLIEDGPMGFGLQEFCGRCGICADNCPSKAICRTDATITEEGTYWKHDEAKCMGMWMKVKNDCGVCMSACPFSQGVNQDLVNEMKGNPDVMDEILRQHREKYGKRNYYKTYPVK
ncbi:4Fe-4S ferredoxin [Vallitalea longa]|uniref:4Fe-4S ferredoxin n=1 Tax=Vallitalea longa TaxID=2936439 RepID=A0A9W5Y7F1_9FIRM|nr:reductive dehalogenase domain-containing protein [Vallitalea longa]GKX27747.1 4Fe-4S ferredoxin [Vallitalea longa]